MIKLYFQNNDLVKSLPFSCLPTVMPHPKNDTTEINKQKNERQKANASVFLFFPNAHFFKTILASRTNGTFGFARHASQPFAKPKEPFFANSQREHLSLKPNK
jgi:hypothetical protein